MNKINNDLITLAFEKWKQCNYDNCKNDNLTDNNSLRQCLVCGKFKSKEMKRLENTKPNWRTW